jgi:hypothetical protein
MRLGGAGTGASTHGDHDYRPCGILLKLYAIALQIQREIANDLFTETALGGLS